jgi:hypothetical protein
MLRLQLIFVIVAISLIVFYFFQKVSPKYLFGNDGPYAGYIYNAMGVVFSVLFAFITVLVWQSYNNVNDSIAKEANHLNNIYWLYSAFPSEFEQAGRESLRSYTETVIKDEWPLLKRDQFSVEAYKKLMDIHDSIIQYQPQGLGESNVHQQILTMINEYSELRRSRIYNAKFALAPPAWIGLISSSLIFLLFSCLFQMESKRIHLILIIFLDLTIVGILYFLILYIHPFLGPMAIEPEPFQKLLDFNFKQSNLEMTMN